MLKATTINRSPGSIVLDPALTWPQVARSDTLWRYGAYLLLLGTCLLFYTWSRTDATETALALDRSRSQVAVLQTENDWLRLELAALNEVGALQLRASQMGLVETVPVKEIR